MILPRLRRLAALTNIDSSVDLIPVPYRVSVHGDVPM
eukprot:COSAG05_NODE_1390_length_5002_cov_2.478075_3_plen_37_part_00